MSDPWASMPRDGELIADLTTLKLFVGARTDQDDDLLTHALSAATSWTYERTMECRWGHPDVQFAILLGASRWYKRRQSPEGVAGFSGEGFVVRLLREDPDVRSLLERHLDLANVGVG